MITIIPNKLTGTFNVISSKSLSHRYVIAAGLSKDESIIDNVLLSEDLEATQKALIALGTTFNGNKISGGFPVMKQNRIDAHESGSTLRFFIPIAMLQEKPVTFIGKGRLLFRPLDVFCDMFLAKGYTFKHEIGDSVFVKGPLKSGMYEMRGDVSSQFLTGLLYALPLTKGDSKITLTTPLESKGYIDLTLDVLKSYGISINTEGNTYHIKGNQVYKGGKFSVEGDYSQAAFFIVAALLNESILLKNLNPDSLQGDKAILDIVKQMGGKVSFDKAGLTIFKSETRATTIDLEQIPDLGPILMVLASLSKGVTHIKNAGRLRIKESDRLDAMYQELTKMGVEIKLNGDEAWIEGRKLLDGDVILHTHNDHRIAMALAVAATRANGKVILDDETVVKKSYPNFFEDYVSLGGKIK